MSETPLTYFDRFDRPLVQALIVLAGSFVIMSIGKLLGLTGAIEVAEDFPWLCSASFLLFFAMFNAIIALSTDDIEGYFRKSLLAFVGLLLLSLGLGFGFSGKWVSEAGSYQTIFVILSFGYLALLSIGGLIKRIAMVLQREEEQYHRSKK